MKLEVPNGSVSVVNPVNAIEDKVEKLAGATYAKLKEAIGGVEAKIDNAMIEVENTFIEVIRYTNNSIESAIDAYDAQLQPTQIVVGAHPKKQSKNRFIQWILIKLFGYELEYKTVMAKTIVIRAEDCLAGFDGDFTFTIEEENNK